MFNHHRGSFWRGVPCLICAGVVALAGATVPAAGDDEVPFAEHKGSKVVPDVTKRRMVRNTGEACLLDVYFPDQNTAMVRSTLWADLGTEFHAARLVEPGGDLYAADLPRGHVALLQARMGKPLHLTYSTPDESGAANGEDTMIAECDLSRRGRRLAGKQDTNKKPSDFNKKAFVIGIVLGYYYWLGKGLRG